MLTGVYGDMGSGKDILLTKVAHDYPKTPILANFKINLPNVQPLEPEMLLELEPSEKGMFVLISEAYAWLESRTSPSKVNRFMSYVGFQSRKRKLHIMCNAQLRSSLDLRFKDLENYTVFCADRPNPEVSTDDFLYRVIKGLRYRDMVYPYKKAKKELFKLYNTNEIILPHDIDDLKADMIQNNPISLNNTVDSLCDLIEEKLPIVTSTPTKEITHDFVKDCLLKIARPLAFESFIYARLRSRNTVRKMELENE